jgi:hypothetical protein
MPPANALIIAVSRSSALAEHKTTPIPQGRGTPSRLPSAPRWRSFCLCNKVDGFQEALGDRVRLRIDAVFDARLVFAGPNENAAKPSPDSGAHVELGIIADHHRVRRRKAHMRHGHAKEIARGFAEDVRLPAGGVFQAGYESSNIQAELPVGIAEGAVCGEREKLCALFDQPESFV